MNLTRSPLRFDARDLVGRPGRSRRISETVPAPEDLGNGVLTVAEGEPVVLDLTLESVEDGVYLIGSATARVKGECVRCLDPVDRDEALSLQELYVDGKDAGEIEDAEDVERLVDGVVVDVTGVLRDAFALDLDDRPLCREDCAGLCPECGIHLQYEPDHHHESLDPRWAALRDLAGDDAGAGDGTDRGTGERA